MEVLEGRWLLSVAATNGWTDVTPEPESRVVYVSSSGGSDTGNTGLSASNPVKSLAQARKLVRSGFGDQVLLRRGDTFRETFETWDVSGRDATSPAVIGAYGD